MRKFEREEFWRFGNSCRRNNFLAESRKAFALFVILGIVFFLALIFFLLSFHSRQFRFVSNRNFGEEVAFQTARGITDAFWIFFQDVLRKRSGCPKLFPTAGGNSPLDPRDCKIGNLVLSISDFTEKDQIKAAFDEIMKFVPEYRNLQFEMRFAVRSQEETFIDGEAILKIGFESPKQTFSFDFSRDFKLVQALPKVVSKFTLFVRETTAAGQYNTISKSIQDDQSGKKLLVLRNSQKSFASTDLERWKYSGWIFLGGNNLILNLDGTHPCRKESEFFIFWPDIVFSNPAQELPFTITDFLGSTKLRVRFTPIGCIKDWKTVTNLQLVLGNQVVSDIEFSSCLRLFGDRTHLSPTRVIGNVHGQYVLYASLIYDSNKDSIPDSISFMGGTHRAIFPIPRLVSKSQFNPPYLPRLMTTKGFDLYVDGRQLSGVPNSISDLFPQYDSGNPSDYVTFMTKLSTDFSPSSGVSAFNSLYDQIFDNSAAGGTKTFPARRLLPDSDYPNSGKDFVLSRDIHGADKLFKGDLTSFDPGENYRDIRFFSHHFKTAQDFLGDGCPFKKIDQVFTAENPIVAKVDDALALPSPLKVEAPVVIVAERDIQIGEIRKSENKGKLVLVSLNGNVVLQGGKIEDTALVAPKGTLSWTAPLQIERGAVCVNKLEPATAEVGGEILYDEEIDPTVHENYNRGVTIVLGPNLPQIMKEK